MAVKELCRRHGFSDASYYLWRSFNGKFRDECLNEHWFRSLTEARDIVATWRTDYNQCRPHSALGYQTPAEFAAACRTRHAGCDRQAAKS